MLMNDQNCKYLFVHYHSHIKHLKHIISRYSRAVSAKFSSENFNLSLWCVNSSDISSWRANTLAHEYNLKWSKMSLKGLITLVTRVHQPNWFLNFTNQVISTGADVFYVKIAIYQDILEFQYHSS